MNPHQDHPFVSRRRVLAAGAVTAGAVTTAALGGSPAGAAPDPDDARSGSSDRAPRDRISVQLYTLRDQLQIDLDGSLAELRRIGYTRIEHAGFVNRTAAQFRAALDAAGLRATSGFPSRSTPPPGSEPSTTPTSSATGTSCTPFFGLNSATGQPIRDAAVYSVFARDLNRAGTLARRAGLSFGYHNHHTHARPGSPSTSSSATTPAAHPAPRPRRWRPPATVTGSSTHCASDRKGSATTKCHRTRPADA
jgi:hypothetical protein